MGEIEKKAHHLHRREKVQDAVLGIIAIAGILSITAIAPNIFQALPRLMGKDKYKLAFQTRTVVGRLIAKGHVQKNKQGLLEITEKGKAAFELQRARADRPALRKRRWDGRYRLVMFDIPQRRRKTRDRLRLLMAEFGFLRLQDSVWVSPYDCEELIALVKAELRVGNDVLYAVVQQIGNESRIKKHFNLK